MTRFAHLLSALAVGLAPALVTTGCGHEDPKPPATSAGPSSKIDDAILRMTSGRCDREVACGNVGGGKRYSDRDACDLEVSQDATSVLRSNACGTVVAEEVDKCLSEVTGQKCGGAFDAVSRMPACRQDKLCTN